MEGIKTSATQSWKYRNREDIKTSNGPTLALGTCHSGGEGSSEGLRPTLGKLGSGCSGGAWREGQAPLS